MGNTGRTHGFSPLTPFLPLSTEKAKENGQRRSGEPDVQPVASAHRGPAGARRVSQFGFQVCSGLSGERTATPREAGKVTITTQN